jgi:hypothetical protein
MQLLYRYIESRIPSAAKLAKAGEEARLDHRAPAPEHLQYVKRRISKAFEGHGVFNGEVLSVRWHPQGKPGSGKGETVFWVMYVDDGDDGDDEELSEADVAANLLPLDAKAGKAMPRTSSIQGTHSSRKRLVLTLGTSNEM